MKNSIFSRTTAGFVALTAATLPTLAVDGPATPMRPVTNTYFGTAVVDNYQWLENFDDPAVKMFSVLATTFS